MHQQHVTPALVSSPPPWHSFPSNVYVNNSPLRSTRSWFAIKSRTARLTGCRSKKRTQKLSRISRILSSNIDDGSPMRADGDRCNDEILSAGSSSAENSHDRDGCDEVRGVLPCCNRGDFMRLVLMSATVLTATAATSTFSVSATSPRVGSTALESDYLTDGESSPQSMECQRSSSSSVAFCDQDSNQGDRSKPVASQMTHDTDYYVKCMFGGVLSCGPTHTAFTPLDVAKCNMQTNPRKYKGLIGSLTTIVREEGLGSAWKGWLPTLLGYSAQGFFKFGLYELFKDLYANLAEHTGEDAAYLFRGLIFLLAAGSAEVFADIALCPMEMVKVKVQTSPQGTFPVKFKSALAEMHDNKATTGFPFGSLVPLWSRQIPYTMTKFYFFEKIVELLYAIVLTEPRAFYSTGEQLAVTFAAGYLAGVICAVVSNPADAVVSKMGIEGNTPGQILSELGFKGAFSGLGTRMLLVGTLTGLQWWIYDTFKALLGMGTTGG